MEPEEFKKRYLSAVPQTPEDLIDEDENEDEFVQFSDQLVASLTINEQDKRILSEVGLPRMAAPYLSFDNLYGLERLDHIIKSLGEKYAPYRVLGITGSGDFICLDVRNNRIVYHNHDDNMHEIVVNSSVAQLAISLCLYAEAFYGENKSDFISEIKSIDPIAGNEGSMWSVASLGLIDL